MTKCSVRILCALVASMGCAQTAKALGFNFAVRGIGSYQSEGPSDLGLLGGGTRDNFFLDVAPRVLIDIDSSWTGYVRGRAFLPSGRVIDSSETQANQRQAVKSFVKLDELWLQYKGLTNYPGESIRVGHQLIRQHDTTWISQDADAVQWIVNTTLFNANLGLINQFRNYRSDGVPLPAPQRDRLYGFGSFSFDWAAEHSLGIRVLHASDLKNLPAAGSSVSSSPKLEDSQLTWLGFFAENRYFDSRRPRVFAYWADVTYLYGKSLTTQVGPGRAATRPRQQDIGAVASTLGVRYKPFIIPISIGAVYTYSGGLDRTQYRQSGLQGNVANYTGTATSIYMYNTTLGAELGNLKVATGFLSYRTLTNDVSIILQNFSKDHARAPIITNQVIAQTNTTSRDIGNGLEVVLSHYFQPQDVSENLTDGASVVRQEPRSSIRLRASLFDPGAAYASGADMDYRVTLETVLWWF